MFLSPGQTRQYGIRFLRYNCAKVWNALPAHAKQITHFSRFPQNNKFK